MQQTVIGEDIILPPNAGVEVFDGFALRFSEVVREAESAHYVEIRMGATTYRGISPRRSEWAYDRFSDLMGKKIIGVYDYFRKYEKGMPQGTFIHSDLGISKWTAVLSLRNNNGAVAFWRHRASGSIAAGPWWRWEDAVSAQGFEESHWEMIGIVPLIENRCVVYPAALMHSRYPRDWQLDTPRAVQVFFFNEAE